MLLNLFISGANGYMGKVIYELTTKDESINVVGGYDINTSSYANFPIFDDLSECDVKADVIIDFSHPSAFDGICDYAKRTNTPIVFATTGLNENQKEQMKSLACVIPVFFSANMSLGINLLIKLAKDLASNVHDQFDIEIVERHHRRKLDAPSGTALAIADGINEALPNSYDYCYERQSKREKRKENEIGISAVRGGTIVGDHTVIFAGHDEVLEIKHQAMSREIFASGSIKAAKYLKDKNAGLYSMNDMFGGK